MAKRRVVVTGASSGIGCLGRLRISDFEVVVDLGYADYMGGDGLGQFAAGV